MGSDEDLRQRTRPDDSEESDEDVTTFFEDAKGKFRSRVDEYKDQSEFPSAPLYSVGEIVYVQSSGGVVSGPYEIVSISAEKYYTIKRIDNGQLHSGAVAESTLCIPV